MKLFKTMYSCFIILFSEAIWIYFLIIIFTGNEWGQLPVFDIRWWFVAGIAGYALNLVIVGKVHSLIMFLANALVLGGILIQNWRLNEPEITLGLGVALSIAISILFLHSASFVFREPSRLKILTHFEWNIIIYGIFTLFLLASEWFTGTPSFHFLFIISILGSLMGMIFTLQNHENSDNHQKAEIYKVGQSSWFAGVMSLLLISIALICLLLFIPAIRKGLNSLVFYGWELLKWFGRAITSLFLFLSQLFPKPEPGGELPPPSEESFTLPEGANEEVFFSLPMVWIIVTVAVVAIAVAFWMISKLLKNRKFTPSVKVHNLVIVKGSWWRIISKKIADLYRRLLLAWRMRYPYFYHFPVYWYYQQVMKWGKRHGLPRLKHETPKEYVEKIIKYLKEEQVYHLEIDQKHKMNELLLRLNQAYQSTYYGKENNVATDEFIPLLKHLKSIRKKGKKNRLGVVVKK